MFAARKHSKKNGGSVWAARLRRWSYAWWALEVYKELTSKTKITKLAPDKHIDKDGNFDINTHTQSKFIRSNLDKHIDKWASFVGCPRFSTCCVVPKHLCQPLSTTLYRCDNSCTCTATCRSGGCRPGTVVDNWFNAEQDTVQISIRSSPIWSQFATD